VNSRDATLNYLYARVMTQGTPEAHLALQEEITSRMKADHIFEEFAGHKLSEEGEFPLPRNFDCLRTTMDTYESSCGRFTDYSLKYVKYLVKACENVNSPLETIVNRIHSVCNK